MVIFLLVFFLIWLLLVLFGTIDFRALFRSTLMFELLHRIKVVVLGEFFRCVFLLSISIIKWVLIIDFLGPFAFFFND